jgi:hypothetical protein
MEAQTASSASGGYSQALGWSSATDLRWLHVSVSLLQAVRSVILFVRHDVGAGVDRETTVMDGAVFVATPPGTVYALRASALGWTFAADGLTEASPLVGPEWRRVLAQRLQGVARYSLPALDSPRVAHER